MSVKAEKETTVIPDKTFPLNVFFTRKIRLHWHDHLEWIYVREGRVRVQIDDMTEVLEKGELAFVHPKQIHGAVPLEGPGGMAAIVFNEALLRNSGLDNTESRYFSPVLTQRIMLPAF